MSQCFSTIFSTHNNQKLEPKHATRRFKMRAYGSKVVPKSSQCSVGWIMLRHSHFILYLHSLTTNLAPAKEWCSANTPFLLCVRFFLGWFPNPIKHLDTSQKVLLRVSFKWPPFGWSVVRSLFNLWKKLVMFLRIVCSSNIKQNFRNLVIGILWDTKQNLPK